MTEEIFGTIILTSDTAFLKKTDEELTSIFTQKFIDDVMNGYVFRPSSPGKPPVVVTIAEVVAGAVKQRIDTYVEHCMALVVKERIIQCVSTKATPVKRTRRKSVSKKKTVVPVTPELTDNVDSTIDPSDEVLPEDVEKNDDASNTPDMYKGNFDIDAELNKDLDEQE